MNRVDVFLFLGAYTLYQAGVLWRSSPQRVIKLVICFASASVLAILFALPRLLNVAHEVMLLSRTSSLQYYGYSQILRFFHEGIYGRYFEENRLIGNGMNVHEGLQLMSSTAAVIVICLGILKPRSLWEKFGAALFVSLFIPLIAELNIGRDTPLYSSVALTMVFWAGIICVGIGFSLLERYRLQYTPNRLPSDRTSEMISCMGTSETARAAEAARQASASGITSGSEDIRVMITCTSHK